MGALRLTRTWSANPRKSNLVALQPHQYVPSKCISMAVIPEKNVIITQRKEPMGPFKYLVVIYVLEKDNQGTKFTYIEEFDVCDNYQNEVEKIYSDISKKVNPILQKITDYFNSEHILQ